MAMSTRTSFVGYLVERIRIDPDPQEKAKRKLEQQRVSILQNFCACKFSCSLQRQYDIQHLQLTRLHQSILRADFHDVLSLVRWDPRLLFVGDVRGRTPLCYLNRAPLGLAIFCLLALNEEWSRVTTTSGRGQLVRDTLVNDAMENSEYNGERMLSVGTCTLESVFHYAIDLGLIEVVDALLDISHSITRLSSHDTLTGEELMAVTNASERRRLR